MKLILDGHNFKHEMESLCMLFFAGEKVITTFETSDYGDFYAITRLRVQKSKTSLLVIISKNNQTERATEYLDNETANYENECQYAFGRAFYLAASKLTGIFPPWGILTGIRPVKLIRDVMNTVQSEDKTIAFMQENKFVLPQKTKLSIQTSKTEEKIIGLSKANSVSLYVSIPFCPTRCSYCSFVSKSVKETAKLLPQYVELLCREISEIGKIISDLDLKLETIYFGGGTPTVLDEHSLYRVMEAVRNAVDIGSTREYTVEAGRPDTINREKLDIIKSMGAKRISINPQTLNDSVLETIGRKHTAEQTIEAYNLAREVGNFAINMDIIAGLPSDDFESFKMTLNKVISLSPENITVHTLSIKRSSDINQSGNAYQDFRDVSAMLDYAQEQLFAFGYLPYYLYRQKNMAGNAENVGWSKVGYEGLYNVFIMDETHTILAAGAGAVSKLKEPNGDKITRIFNFKYPYEYNARFDDILARKRQVYEFYETYHT